MSCQCQILVFYALACPSVLHQQRYYLLCFVSSLGIVIGRFSNRDIPDTKDLYVESAM
jgi:hypothetical protein